jgi:hypothetical protein
VNVYLPKDRVTNNHQGYGFVEYRAEEDADYVRSRVGVRGWAEGCIAGVEGCQGYGCVEYRVEDDADHVIGTGLVVVACLAVWPVLGR